MIRAGKTFLLIGLAGLALAIAALAGCGTATWLKDKFDPRTPGPDQAYQAALEPYLATATVYAGPATELKAAVLPLAGPVRRAMVERSAAALGWTPAEKARRLADQDRDAAGDLELLLSVYVPERKWNDLTALKPDWLVYLVDKDGQKQRPLDVRLIKQRSALNEALYYFWGPWDKLYRLRFKPVAGPARLLITGAPGSDAVALKLD
ncbi:MAG: hypothetical protein V1797_19410 [Pseudomonadota bacterium]